MPAGLVLLERIQQYIITPAVRVLFAAGLFMFFWGIVQYLQEIKDGKANGPGRNHMLWGIVGMFIMVSVEGILLIVTNTFGIGLGNTDVSRIQNVRVTPNSSFFQGN